MGRLVAQLVAGDGMCFGAGRQRLIDTVGEFLLRLLVQRGFEVTVDTDLVGLIRVVALLGGVRLGQRWWNIDDDGTGKRGIQIEDTGYRYVFRPVRVDDFGFVSNLQIRLLGGKGMQGDFVVRGGVCARSECGGTPWHILAKAHGQCRRSHGGYGRAVLTDQHRAGHGIHDFRAFHALDVADGRGQIDVDGVIGFRGRRGGHQAGGVGFGFF